MKTPSQRWFVAVLIVKVFVIGKSEKRPLFDRQFRLLRAASVEQAYRKALKLGEDAGFSYKNPNGDLVRWKFVGLADLDSIDAVKIEDGMEVYSSVRRGNPERAIRSKHQLEAFWFEANKGKPLKELTSASRVPYVPVSALNWVAKQAARNRATERKSRLRRRSELC